MTNAPVATKSGEIVKTADAAQTLYHKLSAPGMQKALQDVLPKHLPPERLVRIAMNSIRKVPALLQCTPESFIGSILQAATLGLEPDNGLGHAYLIPYKTECTLILGYRGLVDLARRSGQVSTVEAHVVKPGDDFKYAFGLNPILQHHPKGTAVDIKPTHVYAVVRLRDGGTQFDVMTKADVDAIRRRSRAGTSGPWETDYDEMAKKTVLRRLCKILPMSIEAQRMANLDDMAEHGLPQVFDVTMSDALATAGELPAPDASRTTTGDADGPGCPLHNVPWVDGQSGIYHFQAKGQPTCSPAKVLTDLAESVQWTPEQANEYTKEQFSGLTMSKLDRQQVLDTWEFIKGLAQTSAAPQEPEASEALDADDPMTAEEAEAVKDAELSAAVRASEPALS